jgi:hypothetical protein
VSERSVDSCKIYYSYPYRWKQRRIRRLKINKYSPLTFSFKTNYSRRYFPYRPWQLVYVTALVSDYRLTRNKSYCKGFSVTCRILLLTPNALHFLIHQELPDFTYRLPDMTVIFCLSAPIRAVYLWRLHK